VSPQRKQPRAPWGTRFEEGEGDWRGEREGWRGESGPALGLGGGGGGRLATFGAFDSAEPWLTGRVGELPLEKLPREEAEEALFLESLDSLDATDEKEPLLGWRSREFLSCSR
jgi:hypothetical protein